MWQPYRPEDRIRRFRFVLQVAHAVSDLIEVLLHPSFLDRLNQQSNNRRVHVMMSACRSKTCVTAVNLSMTAGSTLMYWSGITHSTRPVVCAWGASTPMRGLWRDERQDLMVSGSGRT
jgi:hypothetical protein